VGGHAGGFRFRAEPTDKGSRALQERQRAVVVDFARDQRHTEADRREVAANGEIIGDNPADGCAIAAHRAGPIASCGSFKPRGGISHRRGKVSPVILSPRKGWIGIDFGTRSVKLAQVERAASGLRLRAAIVLPRPLHDLESPQITSVEAYTEISHALALNKHFFGHRAACALSMHWCHVKLLNIPTGTVHEQRSIVQRQLVTTGPNQEDASEFAFWPAVPRADDSQSEVDTVVAVTVDRESAQQAGHDLYRSGLACKALDGMPLALARAAHMTCDAAEDSIVAALDWGYSAATLCIVHDGRPLFVRKLRNCGFQRVLATIATALGLTCEEVESALLSSDADPSGETSTACCRLQELVHDVAVAPLQTIEDEITKTLGFIRRHNAAFSPTKILLFGAGALWNNCHTFLANCTELPVVRWQLEDAGIRDNSNINVRSEILAPAIALSTLVWKTQ
jgi:Tfp pilus assembly PilM family ATPase